MERNYSGEGEELKHKRGRWMLCAAALSAVLSAPVQAAEGNAETKAAESSYYNVDGVLVQNAEGSAENGETAESTDTAAGRHAAEETGTAEADSAAAALGSISAAADAVTAAGQETADAANQTAELTQEEQAEKEKQAEEERLARELFHLLNGKRIEAGEQAYQEDAALGAAAKVRAAEIAAYSEEAVAANPRVIYDRPEAHPFAGTSQLLTSSITALDTAELPYYTGENGSLLVTELPVWRVYSTGAALEQVLEKNKSFLLDQFSEETGEAMQYGFNSMGVACALRGSAAYYSIFIGARKTSVQ